MIELVAALFLIAIVLGSVTQLFLTSLKTGAASAHRTGALALAQRDVEEMRAIPYEELGFSSTQVGFSPTFVDGAKTYNTVRVPSPQLPASAQTVVQGGVRYTLSRKVYWVDATYPTTKTEAYKQTTALVSWSDESGSHLIRQEGIVYPGGQGLYAAQGGAGATTTTTAPAGFPTAPTLAAVPNAVNPSTAVDLSWNASGQHWTVQYSTDNFVTPSKITTVATNVLTPSYAVTGLGTNTVYQFRIGAFSAPPANAGPSWSNVVTLQTAPGATPASCTVTSLTVRKATGSPVTSSIARASASTHLLVDDFSVNAVTSGPCTVISARYVAEDLVVKQNLVSTDNINWTGTLDGKTSPWALGRHLVTIWDEATTTNLNFTAAVTVTAT